MIQTKVAIVDLGERLPINVGKLAEEMNSRLKSFVFMPVEVVTAAIVGDPTIDEEWHDTEVLFDCLRNHRRFSEYDFLVGITHFKIAEKNAPPTADRSYFSLSDFGKVSVISLNKAVSQYTPAGKNMYQYTAFLIVGELLLNVSKLDLTHPTTNYCLFDDCVDRKSFCEAMARADICIGCLDKLNRANVGEDIVKQTKRLLSWCRHDSFQYSLLRTIRNPLTTLALGTGLGWFSTIFLYKQHYLFVLLGVFLLPVLVFLQARFVSK